MWACKVYSIIKVRWISHIVYRYEILYLHSVFTGLWPSIMLIIGYIRDQSVGGSLIVYDRSHPFGSTAFLFIPPLWDFSNSQLSKLDVMPRYPDSTTHGFTRPVWCDRAFMSCLTVVITPNPGFVWVGVCSLGTFAGKIESFRYLSTFRCRANYSADRLSLLGWNPPVCGTNRKAMLFGMWRHIPFTRSMYIFLQWALTLYTLLFRCRYRREVV